MKGIKILISFLVVQMVSSFYKQKHCNCNQLLTQYECQKMDSCNWNDQLMICQLSNIIYTTRYQLENTQSLQSSQTYSQYCKSFNQYNCSLQKSCIWFKNQCSMFTGCSAYLRTTHNECQQMSNLCISDGEKCTEVDSCYKYKNSYSCTKDLDNHYCYWHPGFHACQNVETCDQLPLSLTTHQDCENQFNTCTAKSNGGCTSKGFHCENNLEEISCVTTVYQEQCFWENNKCQEKICDNASTQYFTDQECKQFLNECTTKIGGGCIKRSQCRDAQLQEACTTDLEDNQCIWDGTQCNIKLCEYAPKYFNTNEQCLTISINCITSGNGCIYNYGCESAFIEQACQQDKYKCIWLENKCVQKDCSTAGNSYIGDEQCSNYLDTCIGKNDGSSGCIKKTCEVAPISFQTSHQCRQFLSDSYCILKIDGGCQTLNSCEQIDLESECKFDKNDKRCQWNQQDNKCKTIYSCFSVYQEKDCQQDYFGNLCQWKQSNNTCVQRTCQSAPITLITEEDCNQYYQPGDGNTCTTVKGGGCILKTQCINSNVEQSCTTDSEGNQCFWDKTKQICRLKQCQDYQGNTFNVCQTQNKSCTLGQNGYCQNINFCFQIETKQSCIYGLDGPCIWISNYVNKNQTKGACFQYESCNSMFWTTDEECKQISPYCTTNGLRCIPITDCYSTNTKGGCVTGTDGDCIQSVPSLFSNADPICRRFYSCSQAYYLTHEECQKANKYCTTNGTTGCRDLGPCYYYEQPSCIINYAGQQKNTEGQIVSTGKCVWDTIQNSCREEFCLDFLYTTHDECNQKLSFCTTNGEQCVKMEKCENYINEKQCQQTRGISGSCVWNNNYCEEMSCKTIQNITQCNQIVNCISDGQQCIEKQLCKYYLTKIGCDQGGYDGHCSWSEKQKQCQLINNCNFANEDELACKLVSDKCQWLNIKNNNGDQCIEHTCQSYEKQIGECSYIQNWENDNLTICVLISDICQQIKFEDLKEDNCYSDTLGHYHWNSIAKKCTQCYINENQIQDDKNNNSSQIIATLMGNINIQQLIVLIIYMTFIFI